jgi:hypothetical protein
MKMVWASGLRSRLRSASTARTFGRGNDPALGFASRRVAGTIAVHRDRARPRYDHQPPETHARSCRVRPRFSNPLMGLTASFPTETWPIENCSVSHIPVCIRMLPDACVAGPFSVLMGLMPRLPGGFESEPGRLPV